MSTITTGRHKESMKKFCSLIHWSHVPRRWMTSVLRRIFPTFRSTRFNDLLLHATSIVTFKKTERHFKQHGSTWPSTLVFGLERASRGHEVSSFFRPGIEGTHAGPADYALCPGPDSENILHIVRN